MNSVNNANTFKIFIIVVYARCKMVENVILVVQLLLRMPDED